MGELSNQDDSVLLKSVAAADKAAFAELFGRYAMRVRAFVLRSGMPVEDADELAQEVLVTVWRKAHLYDPQKAAASTWIFAIARNRRIDFLRRRARPEPDPEDPLFRPDPEPTGHEIVDRQQQADHLKAALRTLPPEQLEVVRAAFFDGLSHAEIATHLGLPLGTVKSRIRLAFRQLRTALGPEMADMFRDS